MLLAVGTVWGADPLAAGVRATDPLTPTAAAKTFTLPTGFRCPRLLTYCESNLPSIARLPMLKGMQTRIGSLVSTLLRFDCHFRIAAESAKFASGIVDIDRAGGKRISKRRQSFTPEVVRSEGGEGLL